MAPMENGLAPTAMPCSILNNKIVSYLTLSLDLKVL